MESLVNWFDFSLTQMNCRLIFWGLNNWQGLKADFLLIIPRMIECVCLRAFSWAYSAPICQNSNPSSSSCTTWQVLWGASQQKYKHGNSNRESLPSRSCAICIFEKKESQSCAFTSGFLHDFQCWELLCESYLDDVQDNILVEAV